MLLRPIRTNRELALRRRLSQGLVQAVAFNRGTAIGYDVLRGIRWDSYNANSISAAEIAPGTGQFGMGVRAGNQSDGGDKMQAAVSAGRAYGGGEWMSHFFAIRLLAASSDGKFAVSDNIANFIELKSGASPRAFWNGTNTPSYPALAANNDYTIGIALQNASTINQQFTINGVYGGATTTGGPLATVRSIDRLGGQDNNYAGVSCIWYVFYEWARWVSPEEFALLHRDIHLLTRPIWPSRTRKAPASGHSATSAMNLGRITMAAVASEKISATSAMNLNQVTQAGSATHTFRTGTGAMTLNQLTQAAAAVQKMLATAAMTLSQLTQAGAGTHGQSPSATSAMTLNQVTMTTTAFERFSAAAAMTLQRVVNAASGTHGLAHTGSSAMTLQQLSQSGQAVERFIATSAMMLQQLTMAAVGRMNASGTSAMNLARVTMAAIASGGGTITTYLVRWRRRGKR